MTLRTLKQGIAAGLILLLTTSSLLHAAETVTYYHNDLLGSPAAATNQQGGIIWRENYQAYGEKVKNLDEQSGNAIGYTGHVHDDSTGLTYMQARYYDPVLGRSYADDPVGFVEANPVSFNRYAYANNNPYAFVDPDGEASKYFTKPARKLVRKLWTVTPGGTSKVVKHSKFGKIYKSKSDDLWWSLDNANHGSGEKPYWKVFEQKGKDLVWKADADEFGNFIQGKHKGDTGLVIPLKETSSASMGEAITARIGGAMLTTLTVLDAMDVTNWLSSGDSYLLPDGSLGSAEELWEASKNSKNDTEEDEK